MMSTVGVEHAKFVNPDLTWKTVTKGNRSVTRRTRKQVTGSTIGVMEATNGCARGAESTTVSESEKVIYCMFQFYLVFFFPSSQNFL